MGERRAAPPPPGLPGPEFSGGQCAQSARPVRGARRARLPRGTQPCGRAAVRRGAVGPVVRAGRGTGRAQARCLVRGRLSSDPRGVQGDNDGPDRVRRRLRSGRDTDRQGAATAGNQCDRAQQSGRGDSDQDIAAPQGSVPLGLACGAAARPDEPVLGTNASHSEAGGSDTRTEPEDDRGEITGGSGPRFQAAEVERPDVLYVLAAAFFSSQRGRIVELVNAQRQVAVYGQNELADAGGLMAYSFSVIEQYRSVATVIDKILKGANPAELPVEQPTRFELVLNLRTAKAQGVTFPPAVLLRADRLIE